MNQFCLNAHPGSPKICHGTFQAQFLFWIHLLKKKRLIFFRECFHMMDAVWRLKYLVETYHHIVFSQRWSFSSPIKRYLRRERNYHDLLIIFFGDIVEFLDGNVLRWKMLEMQMPWPDIDVCVIFKKRRCSGWKRGETHWILNIPKAYNSLPLQKWRLCRVPLLLGRVNFQVLIDLCWCTPTSSLKTPPHPAPGVVSPAGCRVNHFWRCQMDL